MHGAKFLAITNNTNKYTVVRQFANWSKAAVVYLCTQAASVVKISLCIHGSLHIVGEELQCHDTTATMSDDRLT